MFWGIIGFIVTIAILVSIHEWGHFWVARQFDVKIVRFSLGFGKPFLTWHGKKDNTLYTLAPIPLGGFVQMLGESPEEDVPAAEKTRTFQAKPAWQRFLIASAGPVVNLLFAVVAFTGLYLYGVHGLRPEIVYVQPHSLAAAAGLQAGDVIVSIDGDQVKLSSDAHAALTGAPWRDDVPIVVTRAGVERALRLDLATLQRGDEMAMNKATGFYLADQWLPAVVGKVLPDSPAAKMGLQTGDKIIAVNGQQPVDIIRISDWLKTRHVGDALKITVQRAGEAHTFTGHLGSREVQGKVYPMIGVVWAPLQLAHLQTVERYAPLAALQHGWQKMIYYIDLSYRMFGRMLTGKASLDNMGGPITIGDAAGKTLRYGVDVFINFLGMISLSLAAINFLPIPMLDGGHMFFYALEMVRGKPLSDKTMQWSFRIGAGVVSVFMGFVIFKDIWKYLF